MEIVGSDVKRALSLLKILSNVGYLPTIDEIDAFVTTKTPRQSKTSSRFEDYLNLNFSRMFGNVNWIPGDPVAGYLHQTGLIAIDPKSKKCRLTLFGAALASGVAMGELPTASGVALFTSTPEKPIMLSTLHTLMAEHKSEMYIDAYLEAGNIEMLWEDTQIRKVLTADTGKLAAIRARLSELLIGDEMEIRVVPGKSQLHDRAIIHGDGGVAIVGSSLNSLEGKYTAVFNLPREISTEFVAKMNALWEKSSKLELK